MILYPGNVIGLPPLPPTDAAPSSAPLGGCVDLWVPGPSFPSTGHAFVVAAPNDIKLGLLGTRSLAEAALYPLHHHCRIDPCRFTSHKSPRRESNPEASRRQRTVRAPPGG